jgi:outer membrane protein assembly factor BamC
VKNITRLSLLGIAVALSACSVLENDKIDYKSAKKGVTLEVPPDLNQLSRDTRYNVPGSSVSARELQAGQGRHAAAGKGRRPDRGRRHHRA